MSDMEVLSANASKATGTMMQIDTGNPVVQKSGDSSVIVQLHSENGEATGPPLDVPLSINSKQLQLICNSFLENASKKWILITIYGIWGVVKYEPSLFFESSATRV